MTDREMTPEEVIDLQAEECATLARQVHELIVGRDASIITVVLARTLAIVSRHTNLPREAVEQQFKFVLDDVYAPKIILETKQ